MVLQLFKLQMLIWTCAVYAHIKIYKTWSVNINRNDDLQLKKGYHWALMFWVKMVLQSINSSDFYKMQFHYQQYKMLGI